jgi:hypothetical protein
MDSFEVTGERVLSFLRARFAPLSPTPSGRVPGFAPYQWGKPQGPIYRGNAEGAGLPHGYVAEKTNPRASEHKKAHCLA